MKKLGKLQFTIGTVDKGDIAKIEGKNVTLDKGPFSAAGAKLSFATNTRESSGVQGYPSTTYVANCHNNLAQLSELLYYYTNLDTELRSMEITTKMETTVWHRARRSVAESSPSR